MVIFVFLLSMEINLTQRLLQYSDWATVLFVICFAVIAVNKSVFSIRFFEFLKLGVSNKYLKIYKDSTNLLNSFTVSMFFVQLTSFSFLILLILQQFKHEQQTNGLLYLQIFTYLTVFILSKYLIEKIIAIVFDIEEFIAQFNLKKVNYRAYFGLILLPIVMLLYYNAVNFKIIYYVLIATLLFFNCLSYFLIVKTNQQLVSRKIFYFILYLCTFEIAPYYFIYYWITKN